MRIPSPAELLSRLEALPAGRVLLERLGGVQAVYLVGGAVRDLLLNRTPPELDLVVEGDALAVARRLRGTLVVHDRFGTCTVTVGPHTYDIARARREAYASPGALPDVAPAPLKEDLNRRDFTVNALAFALAGPSAGRLQSVPGSLEDLDRGLLRVLHDASFIDDPTRLIRLVRYQSRLGFQIEPHTHALASAAVAGGALQTVSGSRIGAELRLLAREPDPVAAFTALRALGVDEAIHPGFGVDRPDLARRALELLPGDGRADLLVLAAACGRIPAGASNTLLDRLAFERAERERIVLAASRARELSGRLAAAARPSEIALAASGASCELVALAGARDGAAAARSWLCRLRHVKLEIDGRDLLQAGVAEGPAVGRGLRAAMAAKLDGRAVGREAELAAALAGAGEGRSRRGQVG